MSIKIKMQKTESVKCDQSKEDCLNKISENLSLDELNKLARAIPELKKSPLWTFIKQYISKY